MSPLRAPAPRIPQKLVLRPLVFNAINRLLHSRDDRLLNLSTWYDCCFYDCDINDCSRVYPGPFVCSCILRNALSVSVCHTFWSGSAVFFLVTLVPVFACNVWSSVNLSWLRVVRARSIKHVQFSLFTNLKLISLNINLMSESSIPNISSLSNAVRWIPTPSQRITTAELRSWSNLRNLQVSSPDPLRSVFPTGKS